MPRSKKGAPPPPLGDLEAELMEHLWSTGESSVRAAMNALNARAGEPRAYTTYMTVLARLHAKGLLERRREGRSDHYRPSLSREEYRERRAAAEVQALVDDYGEAVFPQFARQMARLDPDRLAELQRLAGEGA
jgi:predicted transcriptional regulator